MTDRHTAAYKAWQAAVYLNGQYQASLEQKLKETRQKIRAFTIDCTFMGALAGYHLVKILMN